MQIVSTGVSLHEMSNQVEIIYIKCLILFSGKNKKNITNLLSVELAQRLVKVNMQN